MIQNAYDQIAKQWHANFRGQAYVDRVLAYVDTILVGLPPGARVLDLALIEFWQAPANLSRSIA